MQAAIAYPQRGYTGPFEATLSAIAILLAIMALCIPGDHPPLMSHVWLGLLAMVILLGCAMFLFWLAAEVVGPWEYKRAWAKAFKLDNPDLNYSAIAQVIKHFKLNTTYACVGFENVAATIEAVLSRDDPWSEIDHTTFSWEELHAYRYFATGEGALLPSSCQKQS